MKNKYLNTKQIENQYGIKRPTIRSWVRQGRIKGVKLGKLILISESELLSRLQNAEEGGDFFDN